MFGWGRQTGVGSWSAFSFCQVPGWRGGVGDSLLFLLLPASPRELEIQPWETNLAYLNILASRDIGESLRETRGSLDKLPSLTSGAGLLDLSQAGPPGGSQLPPPLSLLS